MSSRSPDALGQPMTMVESPGMTNRLASPGDWAMLIPVRRYAAAVSKPAEPGATATPGTADVLSLTGKESLTQRQMSTVTAAPAPPATASDSRNETLSK